jgi:hypothetical protein
MLAAIPVVLKICPIALMVPKLYAAKIPVNAASLSGNVVGSMETWKN